jgi:hypothetical protein
MHSHHHHREHQVGHRRVHEILKHEPAGAKKHSHGHAFSKVTSKTAAEHHDGHVHGHKGAKKYARGGRTKGHKGQTTNISIVMPHKGPAGAPPGMPLPAGPGGPPMASPGGPPGMPPPMPLPGAGMPRARGGRIHKEGGGPTHIPGDTIADKNARAMNKFGERGSAPIRPTPISPSMADFVAGARKRGGRTQAHIDGESTEANIKAWGKRASKNSYARGGGIAVPMKAGAATGVGRIEQSEHMKHKKHRKK